MLNALFLRVILAYVEGKRDEIELVSSGSGGVAALQARYPTDRIYFCAVATEFKVQPHANR